MIDLAFECKDGAPQNANIYSCIRDALRTTNAYTQNPDEDIFDRAIEAIKSVLEDRTEYADEGLDKALDRIIELYKDAPKDPNPKWPQIINVYTNRDNQVNVSVGNDAHNEYHNNFYIKLIMPDGARLDGSSTNYFTFVQDKEKDEDD